LDGQLANKADLQRQAENEDAKNRDAQAQLYERETRQRQVEDQLMVSRKEQDNIRFSNNNILERNQDIKSEIDALNSHCNVLQGQNKDLNVELERFVQTDEQIRATLNRRERVVNLRDKTDTEIKRS
jgi:chromosome segregation ATPase